MSLICQISRSCAYRCQLYYGDGTLRESFRDLYESLGKYTFKRLSCFLLIPCVEVGKAYIDPGFVNGDLLGNRKFRYVSKNFHQQTIQLSGPSREEWPNMIPGVILVRVFYVQQIDWFHSQGKLNAC